MEEVLLTLIVFVFAFLALKLFVDYLKEKNSGKGRSAESSMTTSELRALVQDAVEEAFDDRFSLLEKRLQDIEKPRLIPAATQKEQELEHPASPPVARDRDATM